MLQWSIMIKKRKSETFLSSEGDTQRKGKVKGQALQENSMSSKKLQNRLSTYCGWNHFYLFGKKHGFCSLFPQRKAAWISIMSSNSRSNVLQSPKSLKLKRHQLLQQDNDPQDKSKCEIYYSTKANWSFEVAHTATWLWHFLNYRKMKEKSRKCFSKFFLIKKKSSNWQCI